MTFCPMCGAELRYKMPGTSKSWLIDLVKTAE
jgi:hypothetical protein